MLEITINGKLYSIPRLKLRRWLDFEQLYNQEQKAAAAKDGAGVAQAILHLVAAVLDCKEDLSSAPWYEVALAYQKILEANRVKEIPLNRGYNQESKPEPWEYEGRSWYFWWHTFAHAYGWSREQVEDLDIDEALALLQECLVAQQHEREWQYSLTEIAYPYNETTKKGVFKPLQRPDWMLGKSIPAPMQKVKIKRSMLPVGRIINEDGNERVTH